jgi:hypothetical protein
MNLSDYAEQQILAHCLGLQAFPMPTPYIALSTTSASGLESGTLGGEPSGALGYERQSASFQYTGNSVENIEDIIHIATGDWGLLLSMAITDAITGGNILFWDALYDIYGIEHTVPINLNEHKFSAGAIKVSIDGNGSDYLNERVLKHLLGIETFPMPTAHYLAITDKNWKEITTGGYVRQPCTFTIEGKLTDEVIFPMATAPWDNEAIYVGIMDAETDGNALFYSELSPSLVVRTGGELYFKSEDGLILTVD